MLPISHVSHLACECGKLKGLGILPQIRDYCFCSVGRISVDREGSRLTGRAEGNYASVFCGELSSLDREAAREIAEKTAEELSVMCGRYIGKNKDARVLVVGLGNGKITYDAFGTMVCQKLAPDENMRVFIAGVESETGIETAKAVRCMAECTKAELVIALDSLAANSEERLGRVIQLCDSGISPGSGVGAQNGEISLKTIGVPVVSIGVPTAIKPSAMSERGYLLVGGDVFSLCRVASETIADSIKLCFESEI